MALLSNTGIRAGSAGTGEAAETGRSLRFNSADSAYLSRTAASGGSARLWTFNCWWKFSDAEGGRSGMLFGCRPGSSNDTTFAVRYETDDTFKLTTEAELLFQTTQVFRDPSAWQMLTVVLDTGNVTSGDRFKMYVNGTRITAWSTAATITQDRDLGWNKNAEMNIGRLSALGYYANFLLSDIYFIDGTALTPTSFSETDEDTGQLIPKKYTGSFGQNGFHLTFSDNSGTSATTLGKDSSGNSNNWTCNNLSVSAGVGNDCLIDFPSLSGTDAGGGDEVRGNYCTWNNLATSGPTFKNGNFDVASATSSAVPSNGTFGMSSGKWYWEVDYTGGNDGVCVGITKNEKLVDFPGNNEDSWAFLSYSGKKAHAATQVAYGSSFTPTGGSGHGTTVGVALDVDNRKIWWRIDGTWQASGDPANGTNAAYTDLDQNVTYFPTCGPDSSGTNNSEYSLNAGQREFEDDAPSGFKCLCTANYSPTVEVPGSTAFNIEAWAGNNSSPRDITTDFSPDILWVKQISGGSWHWLTERTDSANKWTNNKDYGSDTDDGSGWATVDTNKAVLTSGSSDAGNVNATSSNYQAWYWKTDNTTGSSNGTGSLSSTVSVSTTNGTSIVKYTGGGGATTVGHGLGAKPDMIWTHNKSSAMSTLCYHSAIGATNILQVNQNQAKFANAGAWNDTEPTSTVFSIGSYGDVSGSGNNIVAYVFRSIEGFSKFDEYAGTGAEGNFVYLGFRPKFIIIKGHDFSGEPWVLWDDIRDPYNECDDRLIIAQNESPGSNEDQDLGDILSNGFRLMNGWNGINGSSKNYIYAAWAESPFKYSRAR